jgi:hypothetical protein
VNLKIRGGGVDFVTNLVVLESNDISVVVLFDSRASHSFISIAYVQKHTLPLALLKCQIIVSSPRGDAAR